MHFQEPAHRLFPAFVGLPHRVAEIHPSTRRETGHHLTRIGPRASRDLIGGRAYLRCRAYSAALIGFRLPRRSTAPSPKPRRGSQKRAENSQNAKIEIPIQTRWTTFRNKTPRGSHGSALWLCTFEFVLYFFFVPSRSYSTKGVTTYAIYMSNSPRVTLTYEIQSEIHVRVFTLGDYKAIGKKLSW